MSAVGQELPQPLERLRNRIRLRDADEIEAIVSSGTYERCLERGRIGQKSRSA
jgi:hypothetical protein